MSAAYFAVKGLRALEAAAKLGEVGLSERELCRFGMCLLYEFPLSAESRDPPTA